MRPRHVEKLGTMGVYIDVPLGECTRNTRTQFIGVRVVEVNKQDEHDPNHRSRQVDIETS